jgi:2-dehydro-3-deoxyphosphooctonate aldolase (KDO 8-P synthase)
MPEPFFLIAGPCVIESEEHTLVLGRAIHAAACAAGVPLVFKASFDKANRTSLHSYRGPGLEKGLEILGRVRQELGVPVLTDIHEPGQAERAAEVCDVLQIPAFLCRQTELLLAAARTGKTVNIKKGQFVSPWEMRHAVEKIRLQASGRRPQAPADAARSPKPEARSPEVWLTERGTSFGYQNLVVDMRSLEIMREFGCPVVFDATHSVQLPGAAGAASGGQREFIEPLARAAVAVGIDGLFLEVHDRPAEALSDPATQYPLEALPRLLDRLVAIHRAAKEQFQV